jgi:tRNA pseudouridine55 synthase
VAPASGDGVVPGWSADGVVPSEKESAALRIRVLCSAGTYIRTLAEDIGREVGVGAHLIELRRTRAGRFRIDDAVTLEQLETMDEPAVVLRPIKEAVEHLPKLDLSAERSARARDGLATRVEAGTFDDGASVRMLDHNSNLVAIGIYDAEQKIIKPKIVLV